MLSMFLVVSILAGQLIKFPLFGTSGPSSLDFCVFILSFIGLYRLKFKLKKPSLSITLAFLFILMTTISLILTPLHLTPSEYISSFLYIIRLSLIITFAWLIYSDGLEEIKKNIYSILTISGVGLSVLGLIQFLIFPNLQFLQSSGWDPHFFRTVSTFLDPNFVGAYFVLTLLILFSFFRNKLLKPEYFIAAVITYLALLTTFSRSSYLMFLISGISLSFLEKSRRLIIQVTVLFIVLLLGFQFYTQLVSQPRNIDRGQSASLRLNTWQQGIQLFQAHPILGVGFNAYKYALKKYNLGDEQFLNSHGATSNDSSLLFVASTTGILGLSSYLLFLVWIIKRGLKNNYILVAAMLGLLIHSIFANSLFYPPILLWLIVICAFPKK